MKTAIILWYSLEELKKMDGHCKRCGNKIKKHYYQGPTNPKAEALSDIYCNPCFFAGMSIM